MATPDKKTLGGWFDDFVGVDRKSVEMSKLSTEQKKQLLSRSFVKRRLEEGIKAYNKRRETDGLGTYSFKKHIVWKKFAPLYKDFKQEIVVKEGYHFKSEEWHYWGKVRVVRDERGRIITWGRSKAK